jgi:hypothetical protein
MESTCLLEIRYKPIDKAGIEVNSCPVSFECLNKAFNER